MRQLTHPNQLKGSAMNVKFRTIHYSTGTYLVIEDSDGADVSLLIQDGETLNECLSRHIQEEQRKRDLHARRANRMQEWSTHLIHA